MLASLTAAMLMAMAVGNASANRLSISHRNLFRIEWSSLELVALGVAVVRCAVTLEGSFHSATIPKSPGLLIGYITHASVKNNPCLAGSATIRSETLPWHIRYRGFQGRLPLFVTGVVALVGAAFRLSNGLSGSCQATTSATEPFEGLIEEPVASGGEGNQTFRVVKTSPNATITCVGVEGGGTMTARLAGTGALREVEGGVPGSQNILLRLI